MAPPGDVKVTVARPIVRQVADYEFFTGRMDATEAVEIRARVSGYLTKISFKPGAEVKKGDILFEIDARPYEADLAKAKADVTRWEATAQRAEADFRRSEKLFGTRSTSREEFDKAAADKAEAAASLLSAKAAVDRKLLDLEFTKVVAPIDGRTSRELVTTGNLITADTTLLTTMVSVDKMYLYWDVDERTMLEIQRLIREKKQKSARESEVPVQFSLASESGFPHDAVINLVDNRVDASTGTLRIRGEVKNDTRLFSPGLFVRVRFQMGQPRQAIVINERAVGSDLGLKYVYVVGEKNDVEYRQVTLGALDQGMREITSGLSEKDRVIVNGLQRVRPGIKVDVSEGSMSDNPLLKSTTSEPAKPSETEKSAPPAKNAEAKKGA